VEVDSTLKELERAKADAQNVTASEALAQRKLAEPEAPLQRTKKEAEATNEAQRVKADAQAARESESAVKRKLADVEAALQQTKKEAERATNEAQRAKADAQAARESEAAAKRKLADAEAARTAAEACQSAAKSKPGFGARLRGWILQHYP
jgi:colicin import membrane protein